MIDVSKLKRGDQYYNQEEGWVVVDRVEYHGGFWKLFCSNGGAISSYKDGSNFYHIDKFNITQVKIVDENRPIVSDGGSSDYYKLPNSLVEKAITTSELQTEDIIEHVFGNDFDFGNIFKTLVRLHGLSKGKGKAGNTASYECNKILYSVKKIDKRLSNATITTPTENGEQV